jgi:hypothetical protein
MSTVFFFVQKMDVPEPVQKRLRRIAEHLDELIRVDVVKELGDRGLEDPVYRILRYLTLAEIWEVISHSSAVRSWLHRRGIWKKLAEDRIPRERLDKIIRKLTYLNRKKLPNYFWIILATEAEIFDSRNGHIMRKHVRKTSDYDELSVDITIIDSDERILETCGDAFPNGYYITSQILEQPNIRGKLMYVSIVRITPEMSNNNEVASVVFWYRILVGGGKAMVQTFDDGAVGLPKDKLLDLYFFREAHQQVAYGHFEPAFMLPEEQNFKTIRSEAFN